MFRPRLLRNAETITPSAMVRKAIHWLSRRLSVKSWSTGFEPGALKRIVPVYSPAPRRPLKVKPTGVVLFGPIAIRLDAPAIDRLGAAWNRAPSAPFRSNLTTAGG